MMHKLPAINKESSVLNTLNRTIGIKYRHRINACSIVTFPESTESNE